MDALLHRLRQRPRPVERVLDLGCGDGDRLGAVLEAFPDAYGIAIDYSFARLARATERLAGCRGRVAVQPGDLRTPDFWRVVPGPVDVVLAGEALRHLPMARAQALLSEIFLSLLPSGTFLGVALGGDVASVEDHCVWLRRLGLVDVAIFAATTDRTLFGGQRPCSSS